MTETHTESVLLPPIPERRRGLHPLLKLTLAFFALSASSCVGCVVLGYRTSTEGAAYVTAELPKVATPWNADALIERASPDFLANMPADKARLFVSFVDGRLGSLRSLGTVNSGPWRTYAGTTGLIVTTEHWTDCEFEKGPARVTLHLVWRNGTWSIQGFNLGSDALMK